MPTLCPACGGRLRDWRLVPSSDPALVGGEFLLRRCTGCGTAVTVGGPPPEAHEAGAYGGGRPRLYGLARPLLELFDRRRLALMAPYLPAGSRLLDAGAGRGRFVDAARRAGYDAFGFEPSRRGVQAAAAIGAPVEMARIEEAQVAAGSVAGVTLWHVLEHLDEPAGGLEQIREWLEPTGVLLVGVPNLASVQARVGGARWYHLDVPRHRTHFTGAGLKALLSAQGFRPLAVHGILLEHNPFGMWQSALNRVTHHPSYLYNLLKRNAPASRRDLTLTALGLPLAPLAAVAELLAGAAGRGGTIAVVARRA